MLIFFCPQAQCTAANLRMAPGASNFFFSNLNYNFYVQIFDFLGIFTFNFYVLIFKFNLNLKFLILLF